MSESGGTVAARGGVISLCASWCNITSGDAALTVTQASESARHVTQRL